MYLIKTDDDVNYESLDMAMVLQEFKVFSDLQPKSIRCSSAITKLLYLMYTGNPIASKDATNVFFQISKAFQWKDVENCSSAVIIF